ncbi:MAG: 5'-methylthioadenosine/S-adenosylhomocysteine nucleosidase [Candidatus Promineifilaceae bacterium]
MSREILVITPMHEEFTFFARTCLDLGYQGENNTYGRSAAISYPSLELVLAIGGTGKVQFAVQTQHLLDSGIEPALVICAGAAGALVEDLSVGDVIIGENTVEHDIREGFINKQLPVYTADESIVESFLAISPEIEDFQVHRGTIASGDEDIVGFERRKELHETTGAVAVAWEGAGGARACRFSAVDFIEIRGITDGADPNAAEDFEKNLHIAVTNIARFIILWSNKGLKV